jgi:hypothetical protein
MLEVPCRRSGSPGRMARGSASVGSRNLWGDGTRSHGVHASAGGFTHHSLHLLEGVSQGFGRAAWSVLNFWPVVSSKKKSKYFEQDC